MKPEIAFHNSVIHQTNDISFLEHVIEFRAVYDRMMKAVM